MGASADLGKATARLFQKRGWRVIAAIRQSERKTELSQLDNVIIQTLDIADPEQINAAVEKAMDIANVDVVFNNAGYSLLGMIRIMKAFIPHFRKRRRGLFISTTSISNLWAFSSTPLYHASKHAIESWTGGMARKLRPFGIGIKTIAPESPDTECSDRPAVAQPSEYGKEIEGCLPSPASGGIDDASSVAEVVYEAATDGKDKLRYVVGHHAGSEG